MLITKVISNDGPSALVEITALKGVAASMPLDFSTVTDGVEADDNLTGERFKLIIRAGRPDNPGVTYFTFDSNDGTILTTGAATGRIEPIWTAAQAATVPVGVHQFRLEVYDDTGQLADVPFTGNWNQKRVS